MSITIPVPPDEADLAVAKCRIGVPLTVNHRRLVAIELAKRAHAAGSDRPTCGDEWRMLRDVAAGMDVEARFAVLVAAFTDWYEVDTDVDAWRHQTEPAMSRDEACEYVTARLLDALSDLIVVPAAVTA